MNTASMPGAQAGKPPTLPRAQRRHDVAELKKRAETVRRRIGHVPSADALKRLAADFKQHGLADAGRLDQIEASGTLDGDDEHRLVAYAALVKAAAPTMADRLLDEAARLHGADRFELAALSPVRDGRPATGGRLPQDRDRLRAWIIPRIGYENAYLGAQKRSDRWSGTAAANGEEIADYQHLVLDFDRPPGVSAEAWEPVRDELAATMRALEPKAINFSGGGTQAWFGLEPTTDRAEMDRRHRLFRATMAALDVALGGKAKVDDVSDPPRIMRAPWSINVPNKAKLDKGREIALAYPLHQGEGRTWNPDELDVAIRAAFGAPAASFTAAASATTSSATTSTADRAPSLDALRKIVKLIPNTGDFDSRDDWVAVGHAVWGAAGGDPEGRAIFCDWSDQWPGGGDPEAAGRLYDGIRDSGIGWNYLLGLVRKYHPGAGAELDFENDPVSQQEIAAAAEAAGAPPGWLVEMNAGHFIALIGGKTTVCREGFDTELERPILEFMSPQDFTQLYRHRKVRVGADTRGTPIMKGLGAAWLDHEDRRQYDRAVFLPGKKAGPRDYNLWRGWGVEPKPGDWSLFRAHIVGVICGDDAKLAAWFLDWCALMVQRPWEKPETAIVLRGPEGAGKGIVVRALGEIVGLHFKHLLHPKHLVGAFNAHFADALLLFADEAFFAGDRAIGGVLKGIISEPTVTIERKGKDVITAPNRLRIVMATNEEWAVPAGKGARRFAVFDIAPLWAQDTGYFAPLAKELKAGGLAAFMYDLLARDISNFDHRTAPKTKALTDQKLHSLTGIDRWWYDRLAAAFEVPAGVKPGLEDQDVWQHEVSKGGLYSEYKEWAGRTRAEFRVSAEPQFWIAMNKLCPKAETFRPRSTAGTRPWMVRLPPLAEARAAFEREIGDRIDWGEPADTEE